MNSAHYNIGVIRLEAMKMENEYCAPCEGKVRPIAVSESQTIARSALLINLKKGSRRRYKTRIPTNSITKLTTPHAASKAMPIINEITRPKESLLSSINSFFYSLRGHLSLKFF
jgi:hypothetical protein